MKKGGQRKIEGWLGLEHAAEGLDEDAWASCLKCCLHTSRDQAGSEITGLEELLIVKERKL